jgi:hypothetical protein
LDVFEPGRGPQGFIVPKVTGKQLEWFEQVLSEHADADHVIVMAHTPILTPVWKWSSSGLVLEGGADSPLWKTMKRHRVTLYLCGEVHAITCHERDGIQQIAHGGLFGYNPEVNYLVAKVSPQEIRLELKAIGIVNSGPRLWQVGQNRPLESVTITLDSRRKGYYSYGTIVIDQRGDERRFLRPTGLFDSRHNPTGKRPTVSMKGLKKQIQSHRQLMERNR